MTLWGIVALCCWGAAVFAANVSPLIPPSLLAGLHASRLEGGTVNQLREQVAAVEAETDRMRRENNLLIQRLDLAQQAQGDVTRRVGALEVSLPGIVERLPETVAIDNSVTASISSGKAMRFDTDGGSVLVEQKPLITMAPGAPTTAVEMPEGEAAVADGRAFGVALGFPVLEADSEFHWQTMMGKVGTLLIGLWPVLAETERGVEGRTLIAGPISSQAQAADLCARLDRVGIPCRPVPFKGDPLPLLN